MRILLIGGGGHCHSCIDVIEVGGLYKIYGVVESSGSSVRSLLNYPVVGYDKDLPHLLKKCQYAFITIGQISTAINRIRIFNILKSLNAILPTIISPKAYVSDHSIIRDGSIVMHGAIVNAGAYVGDNCIINTQALVEHDAYIEPHCHVSTGARVKGGVIVRAGSFIGSGAILREGVEIGGGSVIGAGQVILRDVPPGTIYRSMN
jgi:sugar O-acyltransferase (sialic acid O-acetyltransferase NeuD family)